MVTVGSLGFLASTMLRLVPVGTELSGTSAQTRICHFSPPHAPDFGRASRVRETGISQAPPVSLVM